MCVKKSLIPKNLGGYFTGFGAACVDALFALVAAFGITLISKFLLTNEVSIKGIGGLFLIFLGIKEIKTKMPKEKQTQNGRKDFIKEFFSGFSLGVANPFVIFSFLALYAVLGLGKIAGDYTLSAILDSPVIIIVPNQYQCVKNVLNTTLSIILLRPFTVLVKFCNQ